MLKQLWKFIRGLLTVLVALGVLTLIVPRLITTIHSMSRIYNVANAPQERAAIVFGAGLSRSGRPTPILRDRVQTAAKNSNENHNSNDGDSYDNNGNTKSNDDGNSNDNKNDDNSNSNDNVHNTNSNNNDNGNENGN